MLYREILYVLYILPSGTHRRKPCNKTSISSYTRPFLHLLLHHRHLHMYKNLGHILFVSPLWCVWEAHLALTGPDWRRHPSPSVGWREEWSR